MVFWVAFDMDSTLGYFNSLTNYLLCLYPEDLRNMEPDLEIDFAIKDEWKPKIDAAFKEFTKLLAESEQINKMLRPGILQIIELLLKAKSEGKVGGLMIYSNNPQKRTLYLVNELICRLLKTSHVFCPLIYSGDPIRGDENVTNEKHKDTIIRSFLVAGLRDGCGYGLLKRKNVDPANIIFFDDLIHKDIYDNIPKANYFHVQPYVRFADHKTIHAAFLWSLMSQDLDRNKGYLSEVKKLGFDFNNIENLYNYMQAQQPSGKNINTTDEKEIIKRLTDLIYAKL